MAPPQSKAGSARGFSALPSAPITLQHPVPEDLDAYIKNPGAPRAALAVDKEHPEGTVAPPQLTVLQQHMAFWARTDPDTVWPRDTYAGFRALGFPVPVAALAVPVIHNTFAYWTQESWVPDLRLPIRLRRAHATKHGSDSEVFDTEGRFVPEKFEEIWTKYCPGDKPGLSLADVNALVRGNRNIMDPVGWTAAWLEWNTLYYLAARDVPGHGKLVVKDDVRRCFDGTLFHEMAADVAAGRLRRASMFQAGLVPRAKEPAAREAAGGREEVAPPPRRVAGEKLPAGGAGGAQGGVKEIGTAGGPRKKPAWPAAPACIPALLAPAQHPESRLEAVI